jgi:hypothetical protein
LILLPFLLLKPNRRAGAWIMLAPFGLIAGLALATQLWRPVYLRAGLMGVQACVSRIAQILPAPLRTPLPLEPYLAVIAIASGLCALALTVHAAGRWPAKRLIPVSLAAGALPFAATVFLFTTGDDDRRWGALLSGAVLCMILTAGVILTGRLCRKHWQWLRFMVALACWNFVLLFGLNLLYAGSLMIREPSVRSRWWEILFPSFPPFWVGPLALFLVVLTFVLTAFLSPLYRERLRSAFRVPAPQPPAAEGGGSAEVPS